MKSAPKALWDVKPELFSSVTALEAQLGYSFKDKTWLYEAVTHRSALVCEGLDEHTVNLERRWNERLEFLGDSVLGLTISEYLSLRSRSLSEGDMSRIRASLVCEASLARIAVDRLQLGSRLVLGQSEKRSAGHRKPSLLANAVEALIGAVFSDGGWEPARALVLKLYEDVLTMDLEVALERDHKTLFQEIAQARFRSTPTYDVVGESGPAHARLFEVAVYVDRDSVREEWGRGAGTTKKRAAQFAAEQAMERLKESHS